MVSISIRLKELRVSAGLSQQALADATSISKSSINMYERGDREPGLDTIEAFADFFNVDEKHLLQIVRKQLLQMSKIYLVNTENLTNTVKIL